MGMDDLRVMGRNTQGVRMINLKNNDEETDGENHFVNETAYQEKQSEQSKMEDQLMEMVGGSESNVWKLYESIMCVYFDMEEIIKQAVYLQGAYDRERMLK